MADIARLTEVIEPEANALGFDLVRVKMIGAEAGEGEPALQIMAEDPATGQLVIEQCAELSRRISDRMDELEEAGEVLVEGAYRLEVSSPGIDRPLTRPKDFANWAGHEVRVALAETITGDDGKPRKTVKGDLAGIEGDVVTVDDAKVGRVQFPLELIHSAKLVLTDRLIAATRPLDTSGAEEVDEGAEEFLEEEEG
ncbi:ribosome maturation protein RimP [Erythrobacter sp. SG61-1L]|uniref:ribosome maturation protein RimP n=1 Tax=Erythrobacter sp. SG61-1L TaxID=1603897 RepID=UPI0006C902A0|nr:ribosome maturation protein RimP [Erythrobacter sp. SG61-1L]KPL69759.1 ribosome maturation protein RimP [Erythrobacter sp. SG61-1L]KPL69788.1 ribosome maturation protein RimP [Erythrobacter sp. SG61-1L]